MSISESDRYISFVYELIASNWDCLGFAKTQFLNVSELALGNNHDNFLLEINDKRFVLRLCKTSQWGLEPFDQLSKEFDYLAIASTHGLAPNPFCLGSEPCPFILQEFIAGRAINYHNHNDICDIANAIGTLHSIETPQLKSKYSITSFENYSFSDGKRWLDSSRNSPIVEQQVRLLDQMASYLTSCQNNRNPEYTIVHTDIHSGNIVMSPKGPVFLDWEGARVSDPIWDISYFWSPVTLEKHNLTYAYQTEIMDEFFSIYCTERNLDKIEIANQTLRGVRWVTFRALCWCTNQLAQETISKPVHTDVKQLANPEFLKKIQSEYFK